MVQVSACFTYSAHTVQEKILLLKFLSVSVYSALTPVGCHMIYTKSQMDFELN